MEAPVFPGGRSELVVEVTDSGGNPVEDASLVAKGEPLTVQQVIPQGRGRYRVRVVAAAQETGFGPTDLLAMTSPIYAQSYVVDSSAVTDGFIELKNDYEDPRNWEGFLPADAEKYEVNTINTNP